MVSDTFDNADMADKIKRELHPAGYVDGRGYSEAGKKFEALLDSLVGHSVRPEADDSWGFLTPEALAEDERAWEQLMHEGRL